MPLCRVLPTAGKGIIVIRERHGEPQHVRFRPGAVLRLGDEESERFAGLVEEVLVAPPFSAPPVAAAVEPDPDPVVTLSPEEDPESIPDQPQPLGLVDLTWHEATARVGDLYTVFEVELAREEEVHGRNRPSVLAAVDRRLHELEAPEGR